MIYDYKQFKMSNDDEILCEVIEWNNEENDALIVRNVMRVVQVEDFEKGIRFYAFRPWMGFIEDPAELHTINSGHIIAEINPSKELLKHYLKSLKETTDQIANRKTARKNMSLDELQSKMKILDEDEFEEYLEQLAELADMEDSDEPNIVGNVIKFKPKGTLH